MRMRMRKTRANHRKMLTVGGKSVWDEPSVGFEDGRVCDVAKGEMSE